MERYLINYLKENTDNEIVKKYIDFFKIELDWFIYAYGDHLSTQYQREKTIDFKLQLKYCIALLNKVEPNSDQKNILSSVYFADESQMTRSGFNLMSSVFQPKGKSQIIGDWDSIVLQRKILKKIHKGKFTDLYNKAFFEELDRFQSNVISKFRKYDLRALLLYTDQYFACKYLIDIFRKMDRPSMVFSHGLPGIYSKDVDNRADYLMVWGEQIKNNYIKAGFSSDKIKVVGNPKYKSVNASKELVNSLENILVIPCSTIQWHQHEWGTPQLVDRSMAVLYLYQVQRVLARFGVEKVRFRPHPAMNRKWYYNFLDKDFYIMDEEPLSISIQKSTLLIGSISTVFMESLMYGVNYLIYNPQEKNGFNLNNSKTAPPFDGSIKELSIAQTEEDLFYMIKSKYQVSSKILDGYMQPLDLSVLKEIIK